MEETDSTVCFNLIHFGTRAKDNVQSSKSGREGKGTGSCFFRVISMLVWESCLENPLSLSSENPFK